MQSTATSPAAYIAALPEERQVPMARLRKVVQQHLPTGFEEIMSSGMINYAVPHSLYPDGYHCNPKQPLPFLAIASQKEFIAVYHMGIYADENLLNWFTEAYKNTYTAKLDMGKSCIRFKKMDQIPYELLGELVSKITPQQWITIYETKFRSQRSGVKATSE